MQSARGGGGRSISPSDPSLILVVYGGFASRQESPDWELRFTTQRTLTSYHEAKWRVLNFLRVAWLDPRVFLTDFGLKGSMSLYQKQARRGDLPHKERSQREILRDGILGYLAHKKTPRPSTLQ